jgi:hypothetical protein
MPTEGLKKEDARVRTEFTRFMEPKGKVERGGSTPK